MQFSGVVRVSWLDHGKPNDITVDVTDDKGSIEVDSGQARVFDRGTRTYFKSRLGWSSALIEPEAENVPAPDHRWTLSVRRGPAIVGRPTQLVEATRSDGTAAQKLYLDADTNLLLRREVLDARGRVQRSLEFLDLTVDTRARVACPDRGEHAQGGSARRLCRRVTKRRARRPAMCSSRARGTRTASSCSTATASSRCRCSSSAARSTGTRCRRVASPTKWVATARRRYTEPGADVLVWERDGTVFTSVSDAPPDVINDMLDRVHTEPEHGRAGRRLRARPVRLELEAERTGVSRGCYTTLADAGWRAGTGFPSTRRRRKMRRRSRSDAPPHTPWSMR